MLKCGHVLENSNSFTKLSVPIKVIVLEVFRGHCKRDRETLLVQIEDFNNTFGTALRNKEYNAPDEIH